jgi:cbb3-type cytochrome c oxidase subunit III
MRKKENYSPLIAVALGLTLVIIATFQVYAMQEPTRMEADFQREQLIMVTEGRSLYEENCAMCHGGDGEGIDGPALNDSNLLTETADETLFSVISSGVPNTEMPAWNQEHGGPFTNQQILQMVAFIRGWEKDAPDRLQIAMMGNPVNGLVIFSDTCAICHGEQGAGTDIAPALNNLDRLSSLDDEWYVETISEGRPSSGMPTWGTVLSPVQIRDLVSLLRAWEQGETVELPGPEEHLHEAVHVLGHGELEAAIHELEAAAEVAEGEMLTAIENAIDAINSGNIDSAQAFIEEAEALGGHGSELDMDGMDMGEESIQPGKTEAQAALEDLNMGMIDSGLAKLRVALVLAQGDLKEAIEHAIEELEVGNIEEAQIILEAILMQ